MMRIKTIIAAAAIAVTSTAVSADMKPAVIYDMGGKFDKSFNEGVYNGVKKFTDETGIEVMEFEVTNETQREQAMRRMAERGATVVLGVGFAQGCRGIPRHQVLDHRRVLAGCAEPAPICLQGA